MGRLQVAAARSRGFLRDVGLRTGLVKHRPWVWSDDRWASSYADGTLDYFASLPELARYSVIVGYVTTVAPGAELLDVGCGQGVLRQRLPEGSVRGYVGVDPTPTAIAAASTLQDTTTRFVVGDITAVDGDFDIVVCNEVLSVVPEPAALVDELHARVRSGGHLVTSIWKHPGDQQLWKLVDRRFDLIDAVVARNEMNELGRRGWRIALHRRR